MAVNATGIAVHGDDQTFRTPARTQRVVLAGGRRSVRRGSTTVRVGCRANTVVTCRGTVRLTVRHRVRSRRHPRGTIRTVSVGTARFAVRSGRTATVRVHLSRLARTLLAAARHHRLGARASATDRAARPRTVHRSLTLVRR